MADSEVLIRCENVSKKFCKDLKKSLWYGLKGLVAEAIGRDRHHETLRDGEFWASKDISFEVRRGECLGLIGHNGAGKTTLLKMLNGLIRPDRGRIEMRGQVGAMIALGAGFNPILTGRENIYIAGSLRGMSKGQITAKFAAIVAFAEMEEFIDMPVQSYSSGMQVRLGFAVAVNMEPDVLLIDEVLAVGDIAFRMKCYNAVAGLASRAAVIFVSHSMPSVGKLCNRGLLLDHGRIKLSTNEIGKAIGSYYELVNFEGSTVGGDGRVTLVQLVVVGNENSSSIRITEELLGDCLNTQYGEKISFCLELKTHPSVTSYQVQYSFLDADQRFAAQSLSPVFRPTGKSSGKSQHVKVEIPCLELNQGKYALALNVMDTSLNGKVSMLEIREAAFVVVGCNSYLGVSSVQWRNAWSLRASERSFAKEHTQKTHE